MPKQVKKLSVDELTKHIEELTTQDQMDLLEIVQNILDKKKETAKAEFSLIENGKKK